MVKQAQELQRQCEEVVKADPTRKLECEVWRQEGSGSHRCVLYTCLRAGTPVSVS